MLPSEGVTTGFSQADLLEGQVPLMRLDRIRFGPRIVPQERPNMPYQGITTPLPEKPKLTKPPKPPPEPGLERFQLCLWEACYRRMERKSWRCLMIRRSASRV